MATADELIAQLITIATGALDKVDSYAATAASVRVAPYTTLPQKLVPVPVVTLPPAPTLSNLKVDFDADLAKVKDFLDGLEHSWLMSYFPAALPGGMDPLMDTLIKNNVLAGIIVPEDVQEIMWERARAQALRAAAAFEDEAVTAWASRGFSMPGGVLVNQIQMKNQETFHAQADLAAQQAVKALDIQVDAVKFAADIGTRLRLGLSSALTGLVNAYSHLPSVAAEYATAVANAERAAYGAVAEYYKAVVQASDITLRADVANADNAQRYIATIAPAMLNEMQNMVHAAVGAADAYSKSAAASLSGLTGISAVVSQASA